MVKLRRFSREVYFCSSFKWSAMPSYYHFVVDRLASSGQGLSDSSSFHQFLLLNMDPDISHMNSSGFDIHHGLRDSEAAYEIPDIAFRTRRITILRSSLLVQDTMEFGEKWKLCPESYLGITNSDVLNLCLLLQHSQLRTVLWGRFWDMLENTLSKSSKRCRTSSSWRLKQDITDLCSAHTIIYQVYRVVKQLRSLVQK